MNEIINEKWLERMRYALSEKDKNVMIFQNNFPDVQCSYPVVCLIKNRKNKIKMICSSDNHILANKYSKIENLQLIITDQIQYVELCLANKIKCFYLKDCFSVEDIKKRLREV